MLFSLLNCWHFNIYEQAQLREKNYNLGARLPLGHFHLGQLLAISTASFKGYNTFFKLNSAEHAIFPATKLLAFQHLCPDKIAI